MANSNGWGDGASNNLIGWGQGADNAIGWGDSHLKSWAGATDITGFDSAAISYFNATGISGATQQDAIDNLVRGLKDDGIWSKMKALYPFVTDNRNLLNYSQDFSNTVWLKEGQGSGNTPTFTANAGAAPDGTQTASRFQFSRSSLLSVSRSSARQSVTTQQATSVGSVWLKSFNGTTQYVSLINTAANGGSVQVEVTNEWKRFETTFTSLVSGSQNLWIGLFDQISTVLSADVLVWGAQLELASTATTYQPIATTQQAYIANQFKYNLVNPVDSDAAFRLVFNGGWTHSAQGATPNGTNGFADTKFIPSANVSLSSFCFSAYSRTSNDGDYRLWGILNSTLNYWTYMNSRTLSVDNANNMNTFAPLVSLPTDLGLRISNRNSSTQYKVIQNTTSNTIVATANQLAPISFYFGAANGIANYCKQQLAFAHLSDGLTDTQAANLYTRVQAFQTALNRQV